MDQILKLFCLFCPQFIFHDENNTNEVHNEMESYQNSIIIGDKEVSFVEDFIDQV